MPPENIKGETMANFSPNNVLTKCIMKYYSQISMWWNRHGR